MKNVEEIINIENRQPTVSATQSLFTQALMLESEGKSNGEKVYCPAELRLMADDFLRLKMISKEGHKAILETIDINIQ